MRGMSRCLYVESLLRHLDDNLHSLMQNTVIPRLPAGICIEKTKEKTSIEVFGSRYKTTAGTPA